MPSHRFSLALCSYSGLRSGAEGTDLGDRPLGVSRLRQLPALNDFAPPWTCKRGLMGTPASASALADSRNVRNEQVPRPLDFTSL